MATQGSISRRQFLRWVAVVGGGIVGSQVLSACAPAAPTAAPKKEEAKPAAAATQPPAPAKAKKLTFWLWNTYAPAADDLLENKIKEWGKANNVEIETSRDSDGKMNDKIMPALEAGTLPDAMFAGSGNALLMMNAKGLLPLTDQFKDIGAAHGGWQDRLDKYVTRDGQVYFLPYSIDTPMMHFREDIFKEAGVKIPEGQWTWEQLRDYAKQAKDYLKSKGKEMIPWGFGIVKEQHDGWCNDCFRNFGALNWDETGTKFVLKDKHQEDCFRALEFLKGAYKMELFPKDAASWDWSSNNKAYQEEQALVVINAASIYTWCQTNKPALAEVTGLAPKPKDKLATTDASLRYTVVMPKVCKDKETATALIKALYDKNIYAPWLELGFVTNVVKEYDTLEMWKKGKRGAFNQAVRVGVYPGYPAPYDNAAMAEAGGVNDPVGNIVVRVLIDGWDNAKALDETDKRTKEIFAKYFK